MVPAPGRYRRRAGRCVRRAAGAGTHRRQPRPTRFTRLARPHRKRRVARRGSPTSIWGYQGMVPGPTLRVKRGEEVRVRLVNELREPTIVHWHGVRLPNAMDGVPHLTQHPIEPGASFDYRFRAPDAGTLLVPHPSLFIRAAGTWTLRRADRRGAGPGGRRSRHRAGDRRLAPDERRKARRGELSLVPRRRARRPHRRAPHSEQRAGPRPPRQAQRTAAPASRQLPPMRGC